ncbi:MAG: hypothetical protein LBK94_00945 [Prevotellaceae bacterium]|jgi:hypothetical protein|nr:hypothetical protein [Prevotellaceae bacterium]
MKYKVIQWKNPQDSKADGLFYASTVNEGKFALGDFATLRLNLQSEGAPTAEEFNASLIKGVKVVFTSGVELKAVLKNVRFDRS